MGVIFVINKAKLLPAINLKRFSTILFFTSFAGYIFNKHFDTLAATTTVELKLSKVYQSITRLLIDLWQTILTEKLYLTAMIVLPLVYLIWYLLQNTKKLRGTSSLINTHSTILPLMTCLFVLNGVIFNIFSVIILGKYSDIHTARYLMVVHYSPGIFSLVLLSLSLEQIKIKYQDKIQMGLVAAIAIISGTLLFGSKQPALSQVLSPPDYVSCFDLDRPHAGLAGYWQSKPLIAYSQRTIQIASIEKEGNPHIWNNNRYWYSDSWQNPGNLPQFEFIFLKSLDKNAIASRYGEPDRIEACVDSEIWWYKNTKLIHSNLMRDGL